MRLWARNVAGLWGLAAALMFIPMFFALQARVPFWYAALVGAVDSLPAVAFGALVLFAARGRADRGVLAARVTTGVVTAALAFALLYPQLR